MSSVQAKDSVPWQLQTTVVASNWYLSKLYDDLACYYLQVRCKLAAVLLAQHNYEGCQQQLAAAAQQDADDADKELLLSVLQKLQVSWPHL